MRDARRIRERTEDGPNTRLGVGALVALATVVISYNIGLQVGMSRTASPESLGASKAAPLAKLDQAQQKHDAMQFYTRLNQESPKPVALADVSSESLKVAEPDHGMVQESPAEEEAPSDVETPPESAQRAIARLGQKAVAPEPETPPEPEPSKPEIQAANFTVQVSAFQTQEEADAYKASLNRKGYEPYVVAAEIPGKGMWYRVRVGRFEDKSSANEAKAQLALVNIPSFVVAAQ